MNRTAPCLLGLALAVLLPGAAPAGEGPTTVRAFGEEVRGSWAQCPFVLLMAERRANKQLDLDLDGKIMLTGNAAPRVEYAIKLGRRYLRVSVAASMKSHEVSGWHAPDTDEEHRHVLQLDGPGLSASIQASDLASPLVAIFKSAVEECMGVGRSR